MKRDEHTVFALALGIHLVGWSKKKKGEDVKIAHPAFTAEIVCVLVVSPS